MRLIDADKLIEELGIDERCSECQYVDGIRCAGNFVDACMAIFDAPTVKAEGDAVSRQAVLDIIKKCYDGGADPFVAGTICGDSVKALPSAQPEIIRCKDCKHKHLENMVWTCPFGLPGGENFFCGYGAEPYKGE